MPHPNTIDHVPTPGNILLLFSQLSKQIVSPEHIKKWTEKDPVLSTVRKMIQSDGEIPDTKTKLRTYTQKDSELSVVDGTLLWGSRVVIPHSGRDVILQQLHVTPCRSCWTISQKTISTANRCSLKVVRSAHSCVNLLFSYY